MRTTLSYVHRREKERAKKARWRTRKEAIRIDRHKDEPIRGEWRGRFVFTITMHDRITGEFHSLDFYLSNKRVNSYRVHVDGKLWKRQISATRALASLRKKLPRFSLHET